jgi:hypothetical protein
MIQKRGKRWRIVVQAGCGLREALAARSTRRDARGRTYLP